ncbi:MAG: hypothetical protein IJK80_06810, partial [Firmicutes bacterium]|nr:hypothetical protein [Bacillota bacterium]
MHGTEKIKPEDLNRITSPDVNLFIDYCRRYKVEDEKGNVTVYENGNAALAHKNPPSPCSSSI